MSRLSVILLTTIVSTLAVSALAVYMLFPLTPDLYGDGMLLLGEKQSQECSIGGGCAIVSKREVALIIGAACAAANGDQPVINGRQALLTLPQ